jgi:hypothetical protein
MHEFLISYLGGWEKRLSAARLSQITGLSREHVSRKMMTWARERFQVSAREGSAQTVFIKDPLEALPVGLRCVHDLLDILPGLSAIYGEKLVTLTFIRMRGLTSPAGDPDLVCELYGAMCRHESVLVRY